MKTNRNTNTTDGMCSRGVRLCRSAEWLRSLGLLAVVTLLAALSALPAGCTKAATETVVPGSGELVKVQFTLKPDLVHEVEVRSIPEIDERIVKDVWVIQLNDTGTGLLRKPQYMPITAASAGDYTLDVELSSLPSRVYFIANTHNSSRYALVRTTAEIEAVSKSIAVESDLASEQGTPMSGLWKGTPTSTGIADRVSLSRALSKVTFKLSALLPAGEGFELTSVQVKQIPNVLHYFRDPEKLVPGTNGAEAYPVLGSGQTIDYPAIPFHGYDLVATGEQTILWYLPENARGTGTGVTQFDKTAAKAPAGQGDYCTYVELLGLYKMDSAPSVAVAYRVFLGANNTTDYNLTRNRSYTVNTSIRGINVADTRIVMSANESDLSQGGSDGDNKGDAGGDWSPVEIGDFRSGGVVFWVDPADNNNYKVVALDEGPYTKWGANNSYIVKCARSETDSRGNAAAIKMAFDAGKADVDITESTFADAFPANAWCYNYTGKDGKDPQGSWYLPSRNDMQYLYCAVNGYAPTIWAGYDRNYSLSGNATARAKFNQYLKDAGDGAEIRDSYENSYYQTNTEIASDITNNCLIQFYNTKMYNVGKTSGAYTRCIKSIPVPPAIGDLRDGGIVFWVNPSDPTNYRVVSLKEWTANTKWAANGNYVVTGAQSEIDGKANTAAIKAAYDAKSAGVPITETSFEAAFPAASYCYNYTGKDGTDPKGTWYLPAKNELQHLWCAYNGKAPSSWSTGTNASALADAAAQAVFNAYLTTAGGAVMTKNYFWSSTEASGNTSYAWYVNFSYGTTYSYDKSSDRYVRCVMDL